MNIQKMKDENFYCKIFLNAEINKIGLTIHLKKIGNLNIENYSLSGHGIEVDLEDNEDFIAGSKDFLHYPYYLDVFKMEYLDREEYIKMINSIILGLRDLSMHTVTACDFEDELVK